MSLAPGPPPDPRLAHAPPDSGARRRAPGRTTSPVLLVLVFAGFISLGLPDGLLGVAWPSIRQSFGLPLDALGGLFATATAGYLAASLASGWIVGRLGVGRLLAMSAFVTALGLFGYALAPSWSVVVALGFATGLGGGAIDAGLNAYIALAHSARLLSWLHASFGVGAAAGPTIMMAVLDARQPWQLGYALVGGAQLVLGICFLLTLHRWQTADAAPASAPVVVDIAREPAAGQAGSDVGRQSQATDVAAAPTAGGWPLAALLSIVLFLVYTGVETTAGQWAYTLLVEGRGVAPPLAGATVSAYWGALALGRLLAGVAGDRIAPVAMVRLGTSGMLAGAVVVWLDLAEAANLLGFCLIGLSAAPIFPSLVAVTPARFGVRRAASIIGFQVAAASLGIAGLPALAGVLAARIDLEVIPVAIVLGAGTLVGLHEGVLWSAGRWRRSAG